MNERSDSMPRSRFEGEITPDADLQARVQALLNDWGEEAAWLQFSMWHLHQIQAYLFRILGGAA